MACDERWRHRIAWFLGILSVVATTGCGRIAYDPALANDAASDGGGIDAPPPSHTIAFDLFDAYADSSITELRDGDRVDLLGVRVGPAIRVRVDPMDVGSVEITRNGMVSTESTPPYFSGGDSGGDVRLDKLVGLGPNVVTAVAYSGAGATGTVRASATIAFELVQPGAEAARIDRFELVRAADMSPVMPLAEGSVVSIGALPTDVALVVHTDPPEVGSVLIRVMPPDPANEQLESYSPYTYPGNDTNDPPSAEPWGFAVGTYTLSAQPFEYHGRGGSAGEAAAITFDFVP